jgi:hypothetical protein
MAELKDALELLTDSRYRRGTDGRMARMHAGAILVELQTRGADLDTARTLVAEALRQLGGENRSRTRTSPQVGGGHMTGRAQRVDDFRVPIDQLRS